MSRIGWPALLGLCALFFVISALIGGEENQGVLGQMAASDHEPASEAGEISQTRDAPASFAEMPDEVMPEMDHEEFGEPVVDEFYDDFADLSGASDDGEWAEVSESRVAARTPQPNQTRSGAPASSRRSEAASAPLTGDEALLRDLRNSGLFDPPPPAGR